MHLPLALLLLPVLADQVMIAPSQVTSLRDGLAAPGRWSRTSGVWFDKAPADPEVVRFARGRVAFHGFGGVRLDAPVGPAAQRYRIAARVDPVVGDTASLGWVS